MKYIYNENLKLITSFFDEVEEEKIKEIYTNSFIANELIEFPKIEDGKLVSMNEEEIAKEKYRRYRENNYFLSSDEIIQDEKIIQYELKEFERIENGIVFFDKEKKKNDILELAKILKEKMGETGFIFRDNLRQPCREQDKTSVTAKVLELQFTKQPSCEWKFFDKDTGEHIYKTITLQELAQIGVKIAEIILKAMKSESRVIEDLKNISDEDLKTYDVYSKF